MKEKADLFRTKLEHVEDLSDLIEVLWVHVLKERGARSESTVVVAQALRQAPTIKPNTKGRLRLAHFGNCN